MLSESDPAQSSSADSLVGLVVAQVFRIQAQLGAGACSRVYRAEHVDLRQPVAIKVLNREYVETEDIRSRFHREARIATRIAHPAVVSVLMTGELPNCGASRGEAFIVYELVDGATLRQLLQKHGCLGIATSVGILMAMSDAVGAAHRLGIVHRDLKPENLMIVESSQGKRSLRVLDFGLAKLHEPTESRLTHTGAILGTPSYLAPESARGYAATPRSDVYSMATIGYECLVGKPPFRDASAIKTLMQQIECEPEPLAQAATGLQVPEPIAAVIHQNLAKLAESRAEDAYGFAHDLNRACDTARIKFEDFGLHSDVWQACSLERSDADIEAERKTEAKT